MSGTIPPESRAWLRQAAATGGVYPQTILAIIERLEALEAQRETEKVAILDVYELLDELKARADRHYLRIRALEGDPIQQPEQISEEENDRRFEACMAAIDAATPEQINSALEAAQQQPHKDKLDRLIEQDAEDYEEPQTLHAIALRMVDTLERLNVLPEILDTIRRAIREPMEQPAPDAAPVATDDELRQIWIQGHYLSHARRALYDLGREHGAIAAAPPAPPAPDEDLRHLIRFMCRTWVEINEWALMRSEALDTYPVIQGTRNQMNLREIAAQPYDKKRVTLGVQSMLCAQPTPPAMQRLMDAPMDARGYVDLRGARLAPPYSPEGELVEPAIEPAPVAPPAAPAGGLVWRVAMAIGLDSDPLNWDAEARRAIREVACWLRSELVSRRVAERLEQEAER